MEKKKLAVSITMLALLVTGVLTATLSPATSDCRKRVNAITEDFATPDDHFTDGTPPPTQWNKTYGGSGSDVASSVIQTSDGGYMLAGETQSYGAGGGDFWLIRTNSAGRMLWNRTYGGPFYDGAYSVIQTADGGYALAGRTRSYGTGETDFWLVKTDSDGNHEWNHTYGGAGFDFLFSAIRTSDNGFALVGSTDLYDSHDDFWLVKTDSNGIHQWNKTYGGNDWEEAHAVVQTSDGGYAIVGEKAMGSGDTNIWWVKTTPEGGIQYESSYGGENDDGASSLVQTLDGGYAIAGYTYSYGVGAPEYSNFWLVKIDYKGSVHQIWDNSFGGSGNDFAESLISIESGGFALAGATWVNNVSEPDFWLITTDAGGALNWSQTCDGKGYDYSYGVVETDDRGFVLAGYTLPYMGNQDMWLVKVEGSIPRHDLAVIDVAASKTVVGQGYTLFINVTVENQGNRLELFNTTVYANATILDSLTNPQMLTSGSIIDLQFMWNTAEEGYVRAKYIIRADTMIEPPIVDVDPADNLYVNGAVSVSFPGDVDANNSVDALDIYELGRAFSSQHASPNWNANCDIDNNDSVNTADLSIAVENYGKTNN